MPLEPTGDRARVLPRKWGRRQLYSPRLRSLTREAGSPYPAGKPHAVRDDAALGDSYSPPSAPYRLSFRVLDGTAVEFSCIPRRSYRVFASFVLPCKQIHRSWGVALTEKTVDKLVETAQLLRTADLFAALDEDELTLVSEASEIVDLAEGSVVFRPGSRANNLYIIDSGQIVIRSELDDHSGRDVARFIAGETFGELDLLVEAPRTAYAVAATPARVVRFPAEDRSFAEVLQAQPEISARLLFKLLGNIAGRLRSTNKLISENTPWVRELRRQVYVDKLTGLYNAAFLKEQLASYQRDPRQAFTLLMMKPDNFKEINDTYGHEAGDATLKRLATVFGTAVKAAGEAIRYRGNELAGLLPGKSPAAAEALARDLGHAVRTMDISDCTAGAQVTVTASFGIGSFPADRTQTNALVTETHALLFEARAAGGDRILQLEAAR